MLKEILFLIIVCNLFFISGCSNDDARADFINNPSAPGCTPPSKFFRFTGCSGKSVIKNFEINPVIDCLGVVVNNCENGVLEIYNECNKSLAIGELEIPHNKLFVPLIELIRDNSSEIKVVKAESVMGHYIPSKNEFLSMNGYVGDQNFIISYIKTSKLCD